MACRTAAMTPPAGAAGAAEDGLESDGALAALFFLYPLLTFSVVAAIHWEALKLLLKRVKVRDHRPAPKHSFTFVSSGTPEAL